MFASWKCLIAFALRVVLSEPAGESMQSPSQSLFTEGGIVGKETMILMELLVISFSLLHGNTKKYWIHGTTLLLMTLKVTTQNPCPFGEFFNIKITITATFKKKADIMYSGNGTSSNAKYTFKDILIARWPLV